jgi:hypothetical protein
MKLVALGSALILATLAVGQAQAGVGPEPPQASLGNFSLTISAPPNIPVEFPGFASISFDERVFGLDGWDWGGRSGYGCGFVELVDGGPTALLSDDRVIARIIAERYAQGGSEQVPDGLYAKIDSTHVVAGREPCSEIGTTASNAVTVGASAVEQSRSFGGAGMPDFAHGHVLQIWQKGVEVGQITLPHEETNPIQDSWWFRGDENGEILLWYAQCPNGLSCTDENGDGTIDAKDGDYGIVARVSIEVDAPDVTFGDCVMNNPEGTPCPQSQIPWADRLVTLGLRKHVVAQGRVASDIGACVSEVIVRIQRKKGGVWKTIAEDTTTPDGNFRVRIADKEGRYRALAPQFSSDTNNTCAKDISPVVSRKN